MGLLGLAALLGGGVLLATVFRDPISARVRWPVTLKTITNSVGMKLARIPSGEFWMGSLPASDAISAALSEEVQEEFESKRGDQAGDRKARSDEFPRHRVRITKSFYLGATEVTRGQFRKFVDATGYRTEAEQDGKGGWGWDADKGIVGGDPFSWRNVGFEQTDDHPVVNVTYNDAVAFANWLSRLEHQSYRLPTEAEWEYACRAGSTTKYSGGDKPEGLATVGNLADRTLKQACPKWRFSARLLNATDGSVFTAPVGHDSPNDWGLHDLHGNVREWCSDWYDSEYYKNSPTDNPQGASSPNPFGPARAIRGGCWSNEPEYARSASRGSDLTTWRTLALGFRLARD